MDNGMKYEDKECYSFKTTHQTETLPAVGEVLLGEDRRKAKALSDIGSSGGFITHEEAEKNKFEKIRVTITK